MKSFRLTLCCLSLLVLSSCLDTMEEQDHKFVAKIKEHLKKKGDMVKVYDIHSGGWTKVCFTVGDGVGDDALDTVAHFSGLDKKGIQVINREKDGTQFVEDFDWGIYFFYPPNKVEYYEIYRAEMEEGGVLTLEQGYSKHKCASRDYAYFVADSDWTTNESRNSYFQISIVELKQGEK